MRRASIVVGLGFGDEGKGLVTNELCKKANNPIVIRFNGGHQAGHTVVQNGHRHVFSSFGSGTLLGVPTYWSKFCTVYPTALMNEYDKIAGLNPVLFIDPDCPVTTPYDVHFNKLNNVHGSVGVGFGDTLKRTEAHYGLFASDILHPSVLKIKLQMIGKYYGFELPMNQFIQDCKDVLQVVCIRKPIGDEWGTDMIFEGAQGVLLDQKYGFFPHVTRSNTTSKNALALLGQWNGYTEVVMVTRAYHTRHGIGPMGEEGIELTNNTHETNVYNDYQHHFRTGPLDIDLLSYSISCEENESPYVNKKIVMTCCDQVDRIPNLITRYDVIKCYSDAGFVKEFV